jgi:uncharacterized membrane protein YkvA (DUF1232 family)
MGRNMDWKYGPPPSETEQRDFYQKLRAKVRQWAEGKDVATQKTAELVLAAPDLFHLLTKLVADPRVSAGQKAKLGLVMAYFISPIDLLPEAFLGPLGYADDVALAALAINGLMKDAGQEIVLEHWAGDRDVLALVRGIVNVVDRKLGAGLAARLRRILQ